MFKESMGVAILGFGKVGAGTIHTLLRNRELIDRRAGVKIRLVAVADIDLETDRGVSLDAFPDLLLTRDASEAIAHPDVDVVVETIGGTTIARQVVIEALNTGKDVVTANKALLSEYAQEVFGAAVRNDKRIAYEGAIGGGIPLIESLDGPLASSRFDAVWGILNGTSNFILTKMEEGAGDFESVLKEAQNLGYAEADPKLDVGGFDTAHKISLLASICFGQRIDYDDISIEGIEKIEQVDALFAAHNGYQVKLLGIAKRTENTADVRVHPALISQDCPLAHVHDVFNGVYLSGDPVGGVMLYGRGAGSMPTGSAVVADLIQLARGENRDPWRSKLMTTAGLPQLSIDEVEGHFFIRCSVDNSPSVVNRIASILGQHGISVDTAERAEAGDSMKVLVLTGETKRKQLQKAIKEVSSSSFSTAEPFAIPIEEVGEIAI